MNREIKFRGYDGKDWHYGFYAYLELEDKHFIMVELPVHIEGTDEWKNSFVPKGVLPKTIGQYTGLKDKNGKEIFEGDIVRFDYAEDELYQVKYFDYLGAFGCERRNTIRCIPIEAESIAEIYLSGTNYYNWAVIGNIYENPELLEAK